MESVSRKRNKELNAASSPPPRVFFVRAALHDVRGRAPNAPSQLLVYSPVAPTVELLDMLRSSFPAIGPTTKVPTRFALRLSLVWKNTLPKTSVSKTRDPKITCAWNYDGF